MICTIYLLKNKVNGKIYVGQTWMTLESRFGTDGERYKNSIYLYSAIKKYGSEKFFYKPLAYCDNQEDADKSECFYISHYNSMDHNIGYNLKEGGRAGRHSEETKKKISETLKQKIWSEEALRNKAVAGHLRKGKKYGPLSEERKQENKEYMLDWHANNPHAMLGKHHTEEAKQKISASQKGKKCSPESVKLRSEKRKMPYEREQAIIKAYQDGKKIAEIKDMFGVNTSGIYRVLHRNDIPRDTGRNHWDGKTHSEETKKKMSESRKKYWEDKKDKDINIEE